MGGAHRLFLDVRLAAFEFVLVGVFVACSAVYSSYVRRVALQAFESLLGPDKDGSLVQLGEVHYR